VAASVESNVDRWAVHRGSIGLQKSPTGEGWVFSSNACWEVRGTECG